MNIDERDIEKGALPEILPQFFPNSISYLSELNDFRMYAEVWSNKRTRVGKERIEIGRTGYLKTLAFGEAHKRRKVDRVRFDHLVAANSINYRGERNVYGKLELYLQMGRVQTNSIFNKILKPKTHFKTQPPHADENFHSEGDLPETLVLDLSKLGLSHDEGTNKHYFDIPTNVDNISNENQKAILLQILGRDVPFEKMRLLHKVGRKRIRCLLENPEDVIKKMVRSNTVPRLCVAWPFHETLVFDLAGTPEEYSEACLLGILNPAWEKVVKAPEGQAKDTGWLDGPQVDSFA